MKTKFIVTSILASMLHINGVAFAEDEPMPADNLDAIISSLQSEFPNLSEDDARISVNGELRARIADVKACADDIEGFAGIHIDYAPKLRAIVKFKRQPNPKLRQCTTDSLFKARGAGSSLDELEFADGVAQQLMADLDLPHGITLDIIKNRVTVEVESKNFQRVKKALNAETSKNSSLKRAIKLRKGNSFFTSASADDVVEVQGNIRARSVCTTGYNVQEIATGRRGITTAGHCNLSSFGVGGGFFNPNTQRLERTLDWTRNVADANNDLAWYSNANDSYLNRISYTNVVPGTYLAVAGTVTSGGLTTSDFICRLGRKSNDEQCGFYVGRVTRTEANAGVSGNFALARQGSSSSLTSFVEEGDSGGPVYVWTFSPGTVFAVGTNVARGNFNNGELLFNEVEKFSNLGVSIITN